MSPRKLTLDKDRVLAASLQLVRREGLAALSARAVGRSTGGLGGAHLPGLCLDG